MNLVNRLMIGLYFISFLLFLNSCETKQNVLTPEEIADGWQLLFDGRTLNGWKDYNGTTLTQPWHVVDGCIQAKIGRAHV